MHQFLIFYFFIFLVDSNNSVGINLFLIDTCSDFDKKRRDRYFEFEFPTFDEYSSVRSLEKLTCLLSFKILKFSEY